MDNISIKCYCDASFDPKTKIAIIGWCISDGHINVSQLNNTNNTRAEIICLIGLIKMLDKRLKYSIYTDCMGIISRIESKDKLIKKNFLSKKGIELNNADLYKELFNLLTPNIHIVHIRGHVPLNQMTNDNIKFSALDKCVRAKLRLLTR